MTLLVSLVDKDSWYILIWLLPLGLVRIQTISAAMGLGRGGCRPGRAAAQRIPYPPGAEGGIGRYLFNVAGPLLSLSAASFLCDATPRPKALRPAD